MTISPVALAAKKVIDAAWLHGDACDLSSQAAFALESTQMLQTPETAAELARLRAWHTAVPTELTPEHRTTLAAHLGDSKPATAALVASLAKAVRDVREHDHPKWEDLYCLNLTSFMGERMGPVLRRLVAAEARVAELEAELRIGSPWTCEVCSKENTRDVCVICETDRPEPRERTADEDPIACALTDQAEAAHPSYDELTDRQKTVAAPGTCGRALSTGMPCPDHPRPPREDVTPQVRKLRSLLAGQRDAAVAEAGDS